MKAYRLPPLPNSNFLLYHSGCLLRDDGDDSDSDSSAVSCLTWGFSLILGGFMGCLFDGSSTGCGIGIGGDDKDVDRSRSQIRSLSADVDNGNGGGNSKTKEA
jgi:hypothetical protein